VEKDLETLNKKLSNPQFREKAAAEIIEEVQEKKSRLAQAGEAVAQPEVL